MEDNTRFTNLFDVEYSDFKGLKELEYNILKETTLKIDEERITFGLNDIDNKIQPLEIIAKIISNKLVGNLTINMTGSENSVLGKISLKQIMFTKINGLINFSYTEEQKEKKIDIFYTCDDIFYIGKNKKEEKLYK